MYMQLSISKIEPQLYAAQCTVNIPNPNSIINKNVLIRKDINRKTIYLLPNKSSATICFQYNNDIHI